MKPRHRFLCTAYVLLLACAAGIVQRSADGQEIPVVRVLGRLGPSYLPERNAPVVYWRPGNETCTVSIRLPERMAVLISLSPMQVWLLKADGTTVTPLHPAAADKSIITLMNVADGVRPVDRSRDFIFPATARDEAVAAAVRVGDEYRVYWLAD